MAGYILGIGVGEAIVFVLVWGIIKLRDRILPNGKGVAIDGISGDAHSDEISVAKV